MKKSITFLQWTAFALSLTACGGSISDPTSDLDRLTFEQVDGNRAPERTLYLTFDDGPGERTPELAQYLMEQNIPATFFVVGSQARKNRAALSKIQQLGHLVANHSYSHSAMSTSPDPIAELGSTDQVIAPFVSDSIFLFRAPYGDWASRLPDSLNVDYSRYVGPVFWDIGGEGNGRNGSYAADWKCWADGVSIQTCADGYLRETQARGRGIVLMHDTHSQTVDMVKRLVPLWKARNYRFASLDQLSPLAANIRASGGTPLEDLTPGAIECPVGYRQESYGKGVLCTEGENVLGPFTETMTRSCIASGGGRACQSMRWHRSLVKSFRGKDVCPQGARLDRNTRYCVEGIHAFGPFPDSLVGQCLGLGQSEQVCTSARWNRGFLLNLLQL